MSGSVPALEAVIFDMDGLMFDTERMYLRAYRAVGAALDLPNAEVLSKLTMAIGPEQEERVIDDYYGRVGVGRRVREFVRTYMTHAFETEPIRAMPGLYQLLRYLQKRGIPAGIASASPMQDIQHHLESTDTGGYFQAIISCEMTPIAKPEPDLFLLCSKQLGAKPAHCLVLEDSINGIRAAVRAGMLPVMVPDLVQPDEATESVLFAKLGGLDEAIPLLKKLWPETVLSIRN